MKGLTDHQRLREVEKMMIVSVIDLADRSERCENCNAKGFTLYVHCCREVNRPIVTLCKPCTVKRAGGADQVYVSSNRGPGLQKRWKAGARIPLRTDDQIMALKTGLERRAEERAKLAG